MSVLNSPTALRALLLALVLACFAALTAPAARGSELPSFQQINTQHLVLADEWSWHEFIKFWERQAGSMSGVVGTVVLVGAGAVLMILWKGK